MKIIIAPDSFKGSLTALQAAEAMALGINDVNPAFETLLLPAADGGEGTMNSLISATNGKIISVVVHDPLNRLIKASYGVLGDGETCVIEIAEASGLMLLDEDEKNPLITSTYGTGELLVHALDNGLRKFIIGLGGSATNDGGAGLLQALGVELLDSAGKELQHGGKALVELHTINHQNLDKRIHESEFIIACDVENPFVGPKGASAIFGPQKGASPEMVVELDTNLTKFASLVEELTGISLHGKKGAGAAGGVGGALQAFFPCEMKRGIDVVLETISFSENVKDADLVLTGEGKTDSQTLSGKTPFGVAQAAISENKPVILISGVIDEESRGLLASLFTELHSVAGGAITSKESIENASYYLRMKSKMVVENYLTK